MDYEKFKEYRKSLLKQAIAISDSKGEDYRVGSPDAHANFKAVGKRLGQDAMDILAVYMLKHQDAITNYIRTKGQSESEPIRQRIIDNINYLVLLGAMIEEQESKIEVNN